MPGGMPFRLNPYEQSSMQNLAQALAHGLDPNLAMQVYDQTIQGATARRTQNLDTRQQGLMGLRDTAMQLAAQGAGPGAVQNAVGGMAEDLPLMGGPRGENKMGNLQEYVGGLYPEGSKISGLVPAAQRMELQAQMGMNKLGLDPEDTAAAGAIVMKGLQAGTPFYDIREAVKQQGYASGYDEGKVAQLVLAAENAYEGATGTRLDDMRGIADKLRSYAGSDRLDQLGEIGQEDSRLNQFAQSLSSGIEGGQEENPDIVQQLVGQAMSDPRQRAQLMQLAKMLTGQPVEGGGGSDAANGMTESGFTDSGAMSATMAGLNPATTMPNLINMAQDAYSTDNAYTNTYAPPDDSGFWGSGLGGDILNSPRSLMDDILGLFGG